MANRAPTTVHRNHGDRAWPPKLREASDQAEDTGTEAEEAEETEEMEGIEQLKRSKT